MPRRKILNIYKGTGELWLLHKKVYENLRKYEEDMIKYLRI